MGTFRLILALLVACSHLSQSGTTAWWTASAALFAVKAFFILSGFYMALVLDTGYRNEPTRHFYASRALRLLPAYWVVSAATLVTVWVLAGNRTSFYRLLDPILAWRSVSLPALPGPMLAYLVVSVTTLVGADTWLWLGFNPATGAWSTAPAYAPDATSGLALSFVPQAWTIGVEILFYLVAPFVCMRGPVVLASLILGSLAFRGLLANYGLSGEPWSRALLPSELVYFIGGILSYRLYLTCCQRPLPRAVSGAALVAALAIELSIAPYVVTYGHTLFITTVPFMVLVVLIPFSFVLTRSRRLDTLLGNVSYPVYLVHLLVFGVVDKTRLKPILIGLMGPEWGWLAANLALVLMAAWVIEMVAVRPVDRVRVKFGARGRVAAAAQSRRVALST